MASPDLHVKRPGYLVPLCDSRRHMAHPGWTCDEIDAERELWDEIAARTFRATAHLFQPETPMADVPAALRGPNWTEG